MRRVVPDEYSTTVTSINKKPMMLHVTQEVFITPGTWIIFRPENGISEFHIISLFVISHGQLKADEEKES